MWRYRADEDGASLVRKDALLIHLLGLHIMHHHFYCVGSA